METARNIALRRRLVRVRRALRPWIDAGNRLVNHDGLEIAGSMAFSAILTLFPFLIFLFAIAAFFHVEGAAHDSITFVFGPLPDQIRQALTQPLAEALSVRSPDLLTLGVVLALWSASNGVESLRAGLNRAYGIGETRSIVRRRLESLAVVVFGSCISLLLAYLTVASAVFWASARDALPEEGQRAVDAVSDNIFTHYLVAAAILGLSLTIAHLMLPDGRRRVRDVLPGAAVTTIAWLAMAAGFTAYLANFGNYAVIYGGLGGIAAAMVFFYFSATVILFGAELNRALVA
ncbi:MAG: YihY/virulence factor BrkB family protein [Alphaproteobacteria bacterium]|nr:YihY/virulence factor BrkB family protein [Alphaproteobacteria bacterium]